MTILEFEMPVSVPNKREYVLPLSAYVIMASLSLFVVSVAFVCLPWIGSWSQA